MLTILLALYFVSLLFGIKSLFSGNSKSISEVAMETNIEVEKAKAIVFLVVFPVWFIGLGMTIWATVIIDTPAITVMAAIMLLFQFAGLIRTLKYISNDVINKITIKRILGKLYSIIFDLYVIYQLFIIAGVL